MRCLHVNIGSLFQALTEPNFKQTQQPTVEGRGTLSSITMVSGPSNYFLNKQTNGYKGRGCLDMCEIGDTECLFTMIHFHILILRHGPFLLPRTLLLSFLSSYYLSLFSLVPSFWTPVTLWLQFTLNQYPPPPPPDPSVGD